MRVVLGIFLVAFFVGGILSGFLFYSALREFVSQAELPDIPVLRLPSINLPAASAGEAPAELLPLPVPNMPAITPEIGPAELAYVPAPLPEVQEDRTNILLVGIDRRGKKTWGTRADTIIIVTVDKTNGTAGMLSIPRDLQIPIPGNGEDRINTANVWGYANDYPGGGPALLKRTIEVNFDIPIDHYIMVDFRGFEKIIDTLGGVDVDIPKTLHDTKYPDPKPGDPHAFKTIHFNPGMQHMDGIRTLEYARSRMSTSDFDRAKRQQQILVAIRDKALTLNLIPKLPTLAATMMDNVKTDMTLDTMVALAALAPQIDMGNVKQAVLEKPLVYGYRRPSDGAAVQLPKWDLIRPVVDDLFSAPIQPQQVVEVKPTPTPAPPTPTPTLAPVQIEELQDLAREGARVAVQNGTSEPNYAARVAAMLMEKGYQIVEFGDADRLDYANTVIVDYTEKVYTLERLVEKFQVAPENLRHSPNLRSQVDIRIIVGEDFRQTLP